MDYVADKHQKKYQLLKKVADIGLSLLLPFICNIRSKASFAFCATSLSTLMILLNSPFSIL